jgi:transcriptional regulator with XRE-family HTH domain
MASERIFDGGKARRLREQADLSVRDLVDILAKESELHYDRNTLYNVELGHKQPSVELSLAWANALEVPRTELLMDAPELSDTTP